MGMGRLASVLLAALFAAPLAAQAPLPVHVGGRAVHESAGAWRFGWPGIYFESRFRGTGVTVAAEAGQDHLRILVDGVERAVLVAPGEARLTIAGLTAGEHVVRLEKMTESQEGGSRFLGFMTVVGDGPLPAPADRARRIEFIGDSYTVGYGNTSRGRTCTRQEVHDLTDTTQAFAPLVANRLGADYRVIAYSGHGIVRNYDGSSPGSSLPILYERMLPGDATPAVGPGDQWRPQLIVIALGANDFSTPLHAGERWPNQDALRADWRTTYLAFARRLMARQPQARFLLMGRDPWFADLEQVAAELGRIARRPVLTRRYPEMDLQGCDWHPSLADHRAFAALLEQAITGIESLW